MTLISQPGSDYQITEITLDAGHARDIIHLLTDVHSALDHLYLDGTAPRITAPAEDYLRESGSDYTLPAMWAVLAATSHLGRELLPPRLRRPILRWRFCSATRELLGVKNCQIVNHGSPFAAAGGRPGSGARRRRTGAAGAAWVPICGRFWSGRATPYRRGSRWPWPRSRTRSGSGR